MNPVRLETLFTDKILRALSQKGDRKTWIRYPTDNSSYEASSDTQKAIKEKTDVLNNENVQNILCKCVAELSNHTMLCVGIPTEHKIFFKGKDAFDYGANELNNACFTLYSRLEYGISAKSMDAVNYEKFEKEIYLTDAPIWLATPFERHISSFIQYGLKYANKEGIYDFCTFDSGEKEYAIAMSLCPVIYIAYSSKNLKVADNGDGSYEKPYEIVIE